MDPDANLKEQREIAQRLAGDDMPTDLRWAAEQTADATRLAELVLALDEWLTKGGALPRDWCGFMPSGTVRR